MAKPPAFYSGRACVPTGRGYCTHEVSLRADDSIRLSGAQAIVKGCWRTAGFFGARLRLVDTGNDIGALVDMTYVQRAARILGPFLDDFQRGRA